MQSNQRAAVAIYARVSTEDQAERQTVRTQLDFLRKYCHLHEITIADEYIDDGVSGAVPLDERPEGRRLLDNASARRFDVVLVYRLDRLGRSLKSLLSAHEALDRAGVAIRSATEPFDTSSPIGRFLFQLLGSIAELERATITERSAMGKRRVASEGRYSGGRIPVGYDVDADNRIILSEHPIPEMGMSETEMVRELFRRVAAGSVLLTEAQRLNALGVAPRSRYGRNRKKGTGERSVYTQTMTWTPSVIHSIITNPAYTGDAALKSKERTIVCPYPPLIDQATWNAAQATLKRNRKTAKRNAKVHYALRGLIICAGCGCHYYGTHDRPRLDGSLPRRYRCTATNAGARPNPATRCSAKPIDANWIEAFVWRDCREFINNPGAALADAQRRLRERLGQVAGMEDRRREVLAQIAAKDTERERVLTLYRRGRITIEEAEAQMESIAGESAMLREMLESIRAQESLANAQEAHLRDATMMLLQLQEQLAEIEETGDVERKQQIIELLVAGITMRTEGEGKQRTVTATIRYHFAEPRNSVIDSATRWSCPQSPGRN